jgi:hypothetical protein
MTTITTRDALSVRVPVAPRGARLAAALFVGAMRWLVSPPVRRIRSRLDDAAAVRQMAYEVQDSDPGFAADLHAAAARYESLGDR